MPETQTAEAGVLSPSEAMGLSGAPGYPVSPTPIRARAVPDRPLFAPNETVDQAFAALESKPPPAVAPGVPGMPQTTREAASVKVAGDAALGNQVNMSAWVQGTSPQMQRQGEALTQEADRLSNQYHSTAAEILRKANEAPAGSAERDKLIAEARTEAHKYRSEYESVARQPPTMKPVDAMQNFGSAATIVAMLGGLFSRHHMTAALGAAGAAMQAINQNNFEQFQQSYKTWERQSDLALKMVELQNQEIRSLIDDKKMSIDERNTKLEMAFRAAGMDHQADQMRLGAHEKVFERQAGLEQAMHSAAASRQAFMFQAYDLNRQAEVQKYLKAHPEIADASKIPIEDMATIDNTARAAAGLPTAKPMSQSQGREQRIEQAVKALDDQFVADHPGATPAEIDHNRAENRLLVEKQFGSAARQPRSAPAMAMQQFVEESIAKTGHPPTSDELQTFAAKGFEKNREAGAVGNRAASLGMAANATEALIPLVKATSDKINRTEYPTVNSMILAAQKGTGGTDVVRFMEMINSLKYLYSRALSPTGQTRVADLQNFDKIISENWTKGQIDAGLDQILQSLNVEKAAIEKTRKEIAAGGVGSPIAAPTPVATAPTSEPIPVPAGIRGDPDGTGYRKNGKVWVKRGDYLVETPGAVETK